MIRAWLVILAVALFGSPPSALAQPALHPHIATYRVGLDPRPGAPSLLLEARGWLVIEWRLDCDVWLSRQRLGFVGTGETGAAISHDVHFSSWEALDGSRLRFVVRSFENGALQDDFRGTATLEGGEGGVADFTAPEKKTVPLPPGTVFPTDHMRQVIAAAIAGSQFVSHEVFDGFGFDSLTQVTSVIGTPRPRPEDPSQQVWPLSMAYYNVERGEEAPGLEATFRLDEKGVLHDVDLNYPEFRLAGKLEQLELLKHPDC